MAPLDLQPTGSSPKVCFDPLTGILELSGDSYPENSFEFYSPVLSWLKEHLRETEALQVHFNIVYMNSSSIKCVLDMLDLMEEAEAAGKKILINWYYDRENPRALDLAEEFAEDVGVPFHIIPVEG